MLPMVRRPDQVTAIGQCSTRSRPTGRRRGADARRGARSNCEAVERAAGLAQVSDFFSLGTNDLTAAVLGLSRADQRPTGVGCSSSRLAGIVKTCDATRSAAGIAVSSVWRRGRRSARAAAAAGRRRSELQRLAGPGGRGSLPDPADQRERMDGPAWRRPGARRRRTVWAYVETVSAPREPRDPGRRPSLRLVEAIRKSSAAHVEGDSPEPCR